MSKQQLSERDHIHTSEYSSSSVLCVPDFKQSSCSGDSEQELKTSDNNPEEALTPTAQGGQNLRVSVVYVLNMRGKPLMPTSPRKARILLKEKKAKVVEMKIV